MKKTTLIFGFSSGGNMTVMYILICLARNGGSVNISQILMCAAVLLLFIFVFLGIKSYRDSVLDGYITFGKAFKIGILISLVSSLSYTILWVILFNPIFKDFMEQHAAFLIEKLKISGASVVEINAKKEEMLKHAMLYRNPFFRAGIIFIQAFPVEAIMIGIASVVIKKKQSGVAQIKLK